jgi:Trk K+ transport system NAD-binding subunit
MSKGTTASIVLLLIVSFFMVLLFASLVLFLNISPEGQPNLGFLETVWMSVMRTLDPGTMGDDKGWAFRLIMFFVTAYGIVMLSTFIGLVSNGILTKVIELRKGRSRVLEKNHILILGWSSKIHTIISELVLANENQRRPVIVVLANKDKVQMEDAVKHKVPDRKNTKLIFRSGNPIDIHDLEITNPNEAKSIIVLGKKSENSDAEIIKVILAITKNIKSENPHYHIIAEINNQKNLEVAKMIGGAGVELILSDEFISRIMVQTSRQAGLSIVYTDLLDFEGDEIYFTSEPKLFGRTFKEALFSYEKSAVIGIQTPEQEVILNPSGDTILSEGTQIIAISEDDDKVIYSENNFKIQEELICNDIPPEYQHDNILILGWNRRANIIIRELSSYAYSSATITIVAELKNMEQPIAELNEQCPNTEINYICANSADKQVLEGIDVNNYDHLIILSYQDHYEVQQADAKTLITLLHLRNKAETWGMMLNVVSEMLDAKNRELAKVTKADDFIISDNIISLIISQVAENKYLMRVFEQLFKAEGDEIYIKPAISYVELDQELDFYTVLESAQRKNQIAIGYRLMEDFRNESKNYGIVLNPAKSAKITFSAVDFVIVLAKA